jgi:hypothetical protein
LHCIFVSAAHSRSALGALLWCRTAPVVAYLPAWCRRASEAWRTTMKGRQFRTKQRRTPSHWKRLVARQLKTACMPPPDAAA